MARNAQKYADRQRGQMSHSPRSSRTPGTGFSSVGENLAWGSSPDMMTGAQGVKQWYDEIKYTRGGRARNMNDGTGVIGHYTQVVWKASVELGCGAAAGMLVCMYGPAGNLMGAFEQNVNGPKKSESACKGAGGGGGGGGRGGGRSPPPSRSTRRRSRSRRSRRSRRSSRRRSRSRRSRRSRRSSRRRSPPPRRPPPPPRGGG